VMMMTMMMVMIMITTGHRCWHYRTPSSLSRIIANSGSGVIDDIP